MKHLGRSAQRLGFNIHAAVFVPAMAAQAIVNVVIGPPWWVQWPLIGWGVGLLSHWWFVLGPGAGKASSD